MKKIIFIGLIAIFVTSSCSSTYDPGEIYSIDDLNGKFSVVKVITAKDGQLFDLKFYSNKFDKRPTRITKNELIPKINKNGDELIGFVTLHIFDSWKPIFLMNEEISDNELASLKNSPFYK